jgi:hypothetical protein
VLGFNLVTYAATEQVFEEYCELCPGEKTVILRDKALSDNAVLPSAFQQLTGDKIYYGLLNGFQGQLFGAPPPCTVGSSFEEVVEGVRSLLAIFVANGYALSAVLGEVREEAEVCSFKVRLEGPANLWSLQALYSRQSLLSAFDAMAFEAYLRASGWSGSYQLSWSDTAVTEVWSVKRGSGSKGMGM